MGRWAAFDRDGGCCGILECLTEPLLVLHIFSFLDIRALFRLRCVCTSWYDAVRSPAFARLFKHPVDDPWAVLRVRTGLPTNWQFRFDDEHFDYTMKLKNHAELWRPRYSERQKSSLPLGPPGSCFVGLCSSNGLVCGMLMEFTSSVTLAVGNPITNLWKTLPPVPEPSLERPRPASDLKIFMETDPSTGSYNIVLSLLLTKEGDGGIRIDILQYESRYCLWVRGPSFNTKTSLGSPVRGNAFFYTGTDMFPGYDMRSRGWSHALVSPPGRDVQDVSKRWNYWHVGYIGAFMYKGNCYWANFLFDHEKVLEDNEEDLGYAMWQMKWENSRMTWVLVSKVMCRELFGLCDMNVTDKNLAVSVVGDTAVIWAFYRKVTHGLWPPVAYDFTLSKWFTCSEERNIFGDEDVECSYVLLPSLAAAP